MNGQNRVTSEKKSGNRINNFRTGIVREANALRASRKEEETKENSKKNQKP